MQGYQAQNVDAIRAERVVCAVRAGQLRVKAFQVVFHKDGSFFISFPYFRHRTGILSISSIPANGLRESQVNLEHGGKVTSHLVKYSHHVDGRAHFSQDGKVFTAIKRPLLAGIGKELCETAKDMVLAFQAIEKTHSHDLRDPVMMLTSKLSEEQVTVQDITLLVLTRPVTERWERSNAVEEFRQLFDSVVELLKDALSKDRLFAQQYGDAFYDFAFLIFVALPDQWNQPEVAAEAYFNVERPDIQETSEETLAAKVRELIPLCHRSRTMRLDWQPKLFAIIGMAAAIYAETGRESAKSLALDAILEYRDLVEAEKKSGGHVFDDDWDYLQLTSVWARHLLKDTQLSDALVHAVAHGRPFSFGMLESGGKSGWGHYGYPNVHFGGDFGIPKPQNVYDRLSFGVRERVKQWQDRMMNSKELGDTYEMVEKIREPIRQQIVERRKAEKRLPRDPEGRA